MSRLEYWKQQQLSEPDATTIANIERYDCQIVHILEGPDHPSWAYSIGLADTLACPEIAVIGLHQELSFSVINEIAKRVRKGLSIRPEMRLGELLGGDYVCELREVRQQWYEHLFNWANWYYGSTNYPVLQCVWPDLQHRFPWEEGFKAEWLYSQPMLDQNDPAQSRMDRFVEALASSDGKCKCSRGRIEWTGESDAHMGIITQDQVAAGEASVLLVAHDDDGWQMLDGGEVSGAPVIICLHHLLERDPSLSEVADLPVGWQAWRDSVGGVWHREVCNRSEGEG